MSDLDTLQARLKALQTDFDDSFAREPASSATRPVDMIELDVGGTPYALRMFELRGLHAATSIVALPSRAPTLAGLTAIRGVTFAVHDLTALLAPSQARPPIQWLAIAHAAPVALGFSSLTRHLQVAPDDIVVAHGAGQFICAHAQHGPHERSAVLDVAALAQHVIGIGG